MDTRYTIVEGPSKYDVMLALFEGKEVTFTIHHEHAVVGRDDYRRMKQKCVVTGLVVARYSHDRSSFDIKGYLVEAGRRRFFDGDYNVIQRSGSILVKDPPKPQPVPFDEDEEDCGERPYDSALDQ